MIGVYRYCGLILERRSAKRGDMSPGVDVPPAGGLSVGRDEPVLDQAGVAVFVEDDMPISPLERVKCKVDLVDGEIGDAAGAEDDDRIGLISASTGC